MAIFLLYSQGDYHAALFHAITMEWPIATSIEFTLPFFDKKTKGKVFLVIPKMPKISLTFPPIHQDESL